MVKYRNPILLVVLWIITLGIYGIYWLVVSSLELKELKAKDAPNPWMILWMVLLSITGAIFASFAALQNLTLVLISWMFYIASFVIAVIFYWRHAKSVNQVSKGRVSNILLFVFWIILGIVSAVLSQIELNKHAKKKK